VTVRRTGALGYLRPALLIAGLLCCGHPNGLRGQGAAEEALRVIFPADQCTVESGKLDLLCVTAETTAGEPPALLVDGKPGKWEAYRRPVLLSRLELAPGEHTIAVGGKELQIVADDAPETEEPPGDGPVHADHPDGDDGWKDCAACHAVTKEDGLTVIGDPDEPDACLQCHSPTDFEVTHFHPLEPIASCRMCHAVHGSANASLLKGPVKELCAACHE
jgi:predicted CXXCH cytochrome family protein